MLYYLGHDSLHSSLDHSSSTGLLVCMIPCLSMEVANPDRGNAILANARLLYHCMHIHAKFRLVEE